MTSDKKILCKLEDSIKTHYMSLPTNNKKGAAGLNANQKSAGKGSKFIKGGGAGKQVTMPKKIQKTGGSRGS